MTASTKTGRLSSFTILIVSVDWVTGNMTEPSLNPPGVPPGLKRLPSGFALFGHPESPASPYRPSPFVTTLPSSEPSV